MSALDIFVIMLLGAERFIASPGFATSMSLFAWVVAIACSSCSTQLRAGLTTQSGPPTARGGGLRDTFLPNFLWSAAGALYRRQTRKSLWACRGSAAASGDKGCE